MVLIMLSDTAGFICTLCPLILVWFNTRDSCALPFENTPRRLLIPRFYPTPTNVTYSKGELAILYCSVENLGTKTIIWRKQPYNVPITVGQLQFLNINRFYLSHVPHRDEWNLLIKNVQPFDAGTYECQISSQEKQLRRSITLNVIDTTGSFFPEIFITGTRFVEVGGHIYLSCNASGSENPPDDIDWFKDGNVLTTKHRPGVHIEKKVAYISNTIYSTLAIYSAHMADAGTYVCRTSGLLTTSFKVDVLNDKSGNVKREYDELSVGASGTSSFINCGTSSPVVNQFYTILSMTLCSYIISNLKRT